LWIDKDHALATKIPIEDSYYQDASSADMLPESISKGYASRSSTDTVPFLPM